MKKAVIDIGSNSVRLGVSADGKTLYKRRLTTRLGEGLAFSGRLSAAAIRRSAQAVADFAAEAKKDGAEKVYAFATASVRSAENGKEFCEAVKSLCGLCVDVVSGETEAEMGLLGAVGRGDGGMIDLGGASCEVTVRTGGKTVYAKSVNLGSVRLLDEGGRDKEKLSEIIEDKLSLYGDFSAAGINMYAVSGTASNLAAVKRKLSVYDPNIVHGTVMTAEEVNYFADKLLSMTVEEIKKEYPAVSHSADILGGGALMMAMLMDRLKIDKITVSESDNLEGYLILKEGKL